MALAKSPSDTMFIIHENNTTMKAKTTESMESDKLNWEYLPWYMGIMNAL